MANPGSSTAITRALLIAVIISAALLMSECSSKPGSQQQNADFPEKWEFAGTSPIAGALALADDGTLYATSEDGFVYALDPSGKLKWKFEAGPMMAGPTIGPDGTVYVSNNEEHIFAINSSGTEQWAAGGGPYADKQIGRIAAAVDQNFLYTPWRGQIRAIRLSGGMIAWSAGFGFKRDGVASILPSGLIVYPGVGRVDAMDSTGRIIWEYPAMNPPLSVDMLLQNGGHQPSGNFWLESGMAVAADGSFYATASDTRLIAFKPGGNPRWEFKTKPKRTNRATPVIAADGTIYVASGDGNLYALNPGGPLIWSVDTTDVIVATPVLAEDGTIYVVNTDTLFAISPEGNIIGKASVVGGADSAPTLGPDGTIYVASLGGKIMAFAGKHGGLMNSPWPKFQRDLANSGRSRQF